MKNHAAFFVFAMGMMPPAYSAPWSPDGRQIVFSYIGSPENIYLVDADGSNPRSLLVRVTRDFRPEWSADGQQLIFTSVVDNKHVISSINIDGSGLQQMSNPEQTLGDPEYSSDGQWLVSFTDEPLPRDLIIQHVASGKQFALSATPNFDEKSPRWSKDGKHIIYVGNDLSVPNANDDICILELSSGSKRNLTNSPDVSEFHPCISHDGKTIAFIQVVNEEFQLATLDISSGDARTVAVGGNHAVLDPHFSPDDQWLSFTRTDFAEKTQGLPSINKINLKTNQEIVITKWK